MMFKSLDMSVTDRLLGAIAFRLAVLVLMSLAARTFAAPAPAQDKLAQHGTVRVAGVDSGH